MLTSIVMLLHVAFFGLNDEIKAGILVLHLIPGPFPDAHKTVGNIALQGDELRFVIT